MLVSVVIPVYQSDDSLLRIATLLYEVEKLEEWRLEMIFVDDGSPNEETWKTLQILKEKYPLQVRIIRMARNCGQHSATLCGMQFASGEVVVTMDDDLQNPPEEVPKLVQAILDGHDVAVGAYGEKHHSAARNLAGNLVDALLRWLFHLPSGFQLTSFRAISRPVVDAVNDAADAYPYVSAMLLANSSHQINVPVVHEARSFGTSNYTWRRSLGLAANLIFSYSSLPVLFVGALAAFCMCLSVGIGMWSLYRAMIIGTSVPGWASIMVTSSFLNSITLLCLTVYGIYLSRLSRQSIRPRRRFVIAEKRF